MFIIYILFNEEPTTEEQTEIQALFGDKFAPESTATKYVYVTSDSKEDAIKAIYKSAFYTKLLDVSVASSSIVKTSVATAPLQEPSPAVDTNTTVSDSIIDPQKESAIGE